MVDHTACEVGQQDAGGGQEHPSHCCTDTALGSLPWITGREWRWRRSHWGEMRRGGQTTLQKDHFTMQQKRMEQNRHTLYT